MNESKEHHYVSRFLLKNFSDDGILINVYLCKEKKMQKARKISDHFKKHYLYGSKCSIIEKQIFADDIENNFAPMIRELEVGKQYNNNDIVKRFIMSQLVRTPLFLKLYGNIYNYATNAIITDNVKNEARQLGIDDIVANIDPDKKYTITIESLQFIKDFKPFFNSLDKFMIVTADNEFIIGEHPVIIFFAVQDMSKITDPTTVVAMPIAYNKYLFLYRSTEIKPKKHLNESHVRMLNVYQLQQTTNIVACHNISENEIADLDDEDTKNIRENRPLRKIGDVEFINTFQDLHYCWDGAFRDAFDIKAECYIRLSYYAEQTNNHNLKLTLEDIGKQENTGGS
jgi:hypothetical protein